MLDRFAMTANRPESVEYLTAISSSVGVDCTQSDQIEPDFSFRTINVFLLHDLGHVLQGRTILSIRTRTCKRGTGKQTHL